jgi:hypothetical protein
VKVAVDVAETAEKLRTIIPRERIRTATGAWLFMAASFTDFSSAVNPPS